MKSNINSILPSLPMAFEKQVFFPVLGNNTNIIKKANCADSLKMCHEPCYVLLQKFILQSKVPGACTYRFEH